jgi:phage recombination protein Bet
MLALSYCRARGLDPFKHPVHIVPIWNAQLRAEVETVWPGIGELRTTASRTSSYSGIDPAAFGPEITKRFEGQGRDGAIVADVTFPEWCQITVWRTCNGIRQAFAGPRVRWLETFSSIGKTGVPNDRWRRAPYQMIEKCAEAAALRRAFPEEVGEIVTNDEAGQIGSSPAPTTDETEPVRGPAGLLARLATPETEAPPAPEEPETVEAIPEPEPEPAKRSRRREPGEEG